MLRLVPVTALLLLLGCSGGAGNAPPQPVPLGELANQRLDAIYGQGGMGMAQQAPDAVVRFVSLHRKDEHVAYVTHGVSDSRFPHEFVMRVRCSAATSPEPLIEVAPMWPVSVLAELAETEKRLEKVFPPGEHLANLGIPGVELPYRHFVFQMDPVLLPIEDGDRLLAFVQVLPFSDEEWTEVEKIPQGETNTVLKARLENDPLGLVGRTE
jgi:hypothetical protein